MIPYIDPIYLLIGLPGMLFGAYAQHKVKSAFGTWSQVATHRGMTGAQVAQQILDVEGIRDVAVEGVNGFLSDHYDPTSKTLRLSPDVYQGRSVAAAGIAAHEVGHAIQHARSYRWLTMRSQLVPVLNITSTVAMPLFMIGFFLVAAGMAGLGQLAMQIGAILFGGMLVFQLVTLPVEFDASRRALAAIDQGRILTGDEHAGARKVLDAAALTYVAAAVASAMQLLYFLWRAGLLGGRRD